MVLYGSVFETPDGTLPYLAVVTNEDGVVIASKPARSLQDADSRLNDAKIKLLRKMIERRCRKASR